MDEDKLKQALAKSAKNSEFSEFITQELTPKKYIIDEPIKIEVRNKVRHLIDLLKEEQRLWNQLDSNNLPHEQQNEILDQLLKNISEFHKSVIRLKDFFSAKQSDQN